MQGRIRQSGWPTTIGFTVRLLFICSQNKLRSPTAEQVFAAVDGIEVLSAGTNHGSEVPVSVDLIEWADIIFAMETEHKRKLVQRFSPQLRGKPLVVLAIPDHYGYMDPTLVSLLVQKTKRYLRGLPA